MYLFVGGAPDLDGGAPVLGGGVPVLGGGVQVRGGGAPGLGDGAPDLGNFATDTVTGEALVGGGKEGAAAEAAAGFLKYSLIGRSFPVIGRMTSDVWIVSSAQLETAAALDCRLA